MFLNSEKDERKELTPAQIAQLIADYVAKHGKPPAIAVDGGEVKEFKLNEMKDK